MAKSRFHNIGPVVGEEVIGASIYCKPSPYREGQSANGISYRVYHVKGGYQAEVQDSPCRGNEFFFKARTLTEISKWLDSHTEPKLVDPPLSEVRKYFASKRANG